MKATSISYLNHNSIKSNVNTNNTTKEDLSKKSNIKVSFLPCSTNLTISKLYPSVLSPSMKEYKSSHKNTLHRIGLKKRHKSIKVFPSLLIDIDNKNQYGNDLNYYDNTNKHNNNITYRKKINLLNGSFKEMKLIYNKDEFKSSPDTLPIYPNYRSAQDNTFQRNNYYYIIRPENCGRIVKQCFNHRSNWVEEEVSKVSNGVSIINNINSCFITKFNFKWQQNTYGINYGLLSKNLSNKQIVNHFEFNSSISNKANLFMNMMRYIEGKEDELFRYIPFTILFDYDHSNFINKFYSFDQLVLNIKSYLCPIENLRQRPFVKHHLYNISFPFEDKLGSKTSLNIPLSYSNNKSLWIIKAPNLNRGHCIKVVNSANEVKKCIKSFYEGIMKGYSGDKESNSNFDIEAKNIYRSKVVLVQKYLEKPLLYHNRKFDIRIWVLLTQEFHVYVFKEGHLKTCSIDYNIDSLNKYRHLTNYSLQKKSTCFSKYENGNEVSFEQFDIYLKQIRPNDSIDLKEDILKRIKNIIAMSFYSVKTKINCLDRKYCFELFGYDFILDNGLNPFLIEVNSNPGLEESSPLIKTLVPRMIDDALRLTVDKLFPTMYSFNNEDDINMDINNSNSNSNSNSYKKKRDIYYQSPFLVKNYSNNDNLWEFICDLNKNDEQERIPMYKFRYKMNFGIHKVQK